MFRLSDDEQVEGEDESEAKWRTERMEREKFLEQLKVALYEFSFVFKSTHNFT